MFGDDGFLKKFLEVQFAEKGEKDEKITVEEAKKRLLLTMQSKDDLDAPPDIKNKMQKDIEVR